QTGTIERAALHLQKGEREQKAVLYLNVEGKSEKYGITGYQDEEIGFFEVVVNNPYEFEKSANQHGTRVDKELKE
ncbi:MAG: hypothetical protein AAF206_07405, partial [Bacteroidota bacterium]